MELLLLCIRVSTFVALCIKMLMFQDRTARCIFVCFWPPVPRTIQISNLIKCRIVCLFFQNRPPYSANKSRVLAPIGGSVVGNNPASQGSGCAGFGPPYRNLGQPTTIYNQNPYVQATNMQHNARYNTPNLPPAGLTQHLNVSTFFVHPKSPGRSLDLSPWRCNPLEALRHACKVAKMCYIILIFCIGDGVYCQIQSGLVLLLQLINGVFFFK